jgi:cyclophilin family peptidyl-prolyl cis-trans isomerase
MTGRLRIRYSHSEVLDRYLALHRELAGRFSWETSVLARPVTAEVARFTDGVRKWREAGLNSLPAWLAADTVDELVTSGGHQMRAGSLDVAAALAAADAELSQALDALAGLRTQALRTLESGLRLDEFAAPLTEALGVGQAEFVLPLHCVLLAPLPAAGFLDDSGRLAAAYVDCRRYRGAMLVESVLTLICWALLRGNTGTGSLGAQLAARLPGTGPYYRRLRAVLIKILVEMTAGALIRVSEPDHRPGVDVLGSAWRFPRLYGAAKRHWEPYLSGLADRGDALDALAAELSAYSPRWYIDCVDAGSLAADFYLTEWLAAAGDAGCARDFARWLPQLARDFAGQIDLVVGAELGHFERAGDDGLPEPLAAFLRQVTSGDSQWTWPKVRAEVGQARALDLAVEAFSVPGTEFGGEAWAPIAAMLRRYECGELPQRVFVDQCFTLQHNNGCVFDKCFDITDVPAVLDAQAAGDLTTLALHASAQTRAAWRRHQFSRRADYDPAWLGLPSDLAACQDRDDAGDPDRADHWHPGELGWFELAIDAAPPGSLGCGSALHPGEFDAGLPDDAESPVRPRRFAYRQVRQEPAERYEQATAVLHTGSGPIRLVLWPKLVPETVANFVGLARGSRPWTDPATRASRNGPFYDGTSFHRRIPGYLVQGGDRTGTGAAGPGYRITDEMHPELTFDRPFMLAMANVGRDSAGSQFFITLAPARHLTGQYAVFGEVTDQESRHVAVAIASSPVPVSLCTVTVTTTS